jgi:hypothetical protein
VVPRRHIRVGCRIRVRVRSVPSMPPTPPGLVSSFPALVPSFPASAAPMAGSRKRPHKQEEDDRPDDPRHQSTHCHLGHT